MLRNLQNLLENSPKALKLQVCLPLKELHHGWRILKKLAIFFKFAVRNPS